MSNLAVVWRTSAHALVEQCQMVVVVADELGFLGPGIPNLVIELCPPQNAA